MNRFFPPIEPFRTHSVAVFRGHPLYVEKCIHTILFDHRGFGCPHPHVELTGNNTQAPLGRLAETGYSTAEEGVVDVLVTATGQFTTRFG